MKLNLGSYIYPLKDFWNIDITKWDGVDQVVDLNVLPWPFGNSSFEEIRAVDIIEHLGKLTKVEIVQELARITKKGGKVVVRVPNYLHPWGFASLQHAHAFQYNSFEESYAQPWFRVESIALRFGDGGREYRLSFWNRWMCKVGLVFTLTFYLVCLDEPSL